MAGILARNFGGPDDLHAVEPLRVRPFSDRRIFELLLGAFTQPPFARLMAKTRGPSMRRNDALIGGFSTLGAISRAQAQALGARLRPALLAALCDGARTAGTARVKGARLSIASTAGAPFREDR